MSDHTVPRALYDEAAKEQHESLIKLLLFCVFDGRCIFCVPVLAVFPVDLGRRNERIQNLKKGAIGFCAGGRTMTRTLLGISKAITQSRYA